MIFKGLPPQRSSASELGEEAGKMRIAAGRRTPPDVNDFHILTRKVLSKQLKSDVDDSRRRCQQIIRRCLVFRSVHLAIRPPCFALTVLQT
jgi:hypothetical protein